MKFLFFVIKNIKKFELEKKKEVEKNRASGDIHVSLNSQGKMNMSAAPSCTLT